jgi:hypothetical protein
MCNYKKDGWLKIIVTMAAQKWPNTPEMSSSRLVDMQELVIQIGSNISEASTEKRATVTVDAAALTNAQKISACAMCTHGIKTVLLTGEGLVFVYEGSAGRTLKNSTV